MTCPQREAILRCARSIPRSPRWRSRGWLNRRWPRDPGGDLGAAASAPTSARATRHAARRVPPGAAVVAQGPACAAAHALPIRPIRPEDAWCEDAGDRRYNRSIRLRAAQQPDSGWRAKITSRLHRRDRPQHRPRIKVAAARYFCTCAPENFGPPPAASPCRPPA